MQPHPTRLLDQVHHILPLKHYASSTEETYVSRTRRYILFRNIQHPREMGIDEIAAFLTHLAVE
jgi:hypothetical protein